MSEETGTRAEPTAEEIAQARKRRHPLFWLIPREGYFITPIIINLNILVLLAMVATGVHPLVPDPEILVKWGANIRSKTMYGEPWRMFTCMFLHYGLIHLAVNMWALFSLGRMLEPFIGRWRFLILYILSGLAASAVSMWYHDLSAAVGASGAIFGIFGIFAALLTTDIIRKDIRSRMLRSILITIGINLIIGLSWHIDNSAHIGGLIAGVIGGYLCYFDLKKFYIQRIVTYRFLFADIFVIACGIVFFWMITGPSVNPEMMTHRFQQYDSTAVAFLRQVDSTTTADEILNKAFTPYVKCSEIADSLNALDVPDEAKQVLSLFGVYADARVNQVTYLYDHAVAHKPAREDSLLYFNKTSEDALSNLNKALTPPAEDGN